MRGGPPTGDAQQGASLTSVPEPATLLLLGSGVVGLTLLGRSKRA
ncbi:MAG TPA: PEP-CTERM sorting domain-containing protein [Terriglobales bacterium]|nr:PEP-CTERM sorting domain-containing protein [Terriglobales bacterium]